MDKLISLTEQAILDNFNFPAHPCKRVNGLGGNNGDFTGFTKLEAASLMIAQGVITDYPLPITPKQAASITETAIRIATMILEGANK